jgi:hypothetical protein
LQAKRHANQTIPIREIIFLRARGVRQVETRGATEKEKEEEEREGGRDRRESTLRGGLPRSRDTSITRYRATARARQIRAITSRLGAGVKCANVSDRHESVRKPVELQPPPGYKVRGQTLRRGVKVE